MKKTLFFMIVLAVALTANGQVTFTSEVVSTTGSNRAVVDMNGDYLDDIVSISTSNVNILYQQGDGSFVPVNINTTPADNDPSWSLAAGDFDDNGYTDLLYGGGNGVTIMKANNDGTAFTEISYPEYVFSQRSNFVDINNDNHLDAFVCHDVAPNVYYLNDGNGNLIYNVGGIGDTSNGGHYGSVWIDFDNDGDMDMYNAKCNVSGTLNERSEDELHENDGTGTFTEIGDSSGILDQMQTWSGTWADFDNDGDLDIFVGSSSNGAPHKLEINNGDSTFTDISGSSGVTVLTATGIENCSYDLNNDGWVDIISNGNVFYNNGDLTFTLDAGALPSNNGSFGDLNNDGFIDTFTGSTIFYNDENANNWITINTIGTESNLNGIGARIQLQSDLGNQIREVRSGEGFRYMSTLNTHLGLGDDTIIDVLTITWPSGIVDTLFDVAVNQVLSVVEGSTILGVGDNEVTNMIAYPNPTRDVLNLNVSENLNDASYSIFTVEGKLVASNTLKSQSIDVSALASGNYILKVFNNTISQTQKFIKQ